MKKRKCGHRYLTAGRLLAVLAGVFWLCSCQKEGETPGKEPAGGLQVMEETGECPADKLPAYLLKESSETPYACAEINITQTEDGKDRADIVWEIFSEAEEFQTYFSEKEQDGISGGNPGVWLYYRYQLPGDLHAIDLYRFLKERYDEEENPFYAIKYDEGNRECYAFTQYPIREMVVRDGAIYTLECLAGSETMAEDAVRELLMDFGKRVQNNKDTYYSGWVLDEETLYWIDHKERETQQENPSRSFTEVRAVDTNWSGRAIMEYFGMLKEAEYQIRLWGDGPMLEIRFDFAEEIPEGGYEKFLLNGFCIDEKYRMTVRDVEKDEILQKTEVSMSIEMPDMITFTDLDGDGFSDMKIGCPTHWNGGRAQMDEFADYSYWMWKPEENKFEFSRYVSSREEMQESAQVQENGAAGYVVKPGDTLWGIAGKFYGKGALYGEIEKENADILSGHRYLMPGMALEIPDIQ